MAPTKSNKVAAKAAGRARPLSTAQQKILAVLRRGAGQAAKKRAQAVKEALAYAQKRPKPISPEELLERVGRGMGATAPASLPLRATREAQELLTGVAKKHPHAALRFAPVDRRGGELRLSLDGKGDGEPLGAYRYAEAPDADPAFGAALKVNANGALEATIHYPGAASPRRSMNQGGVLHDLRLARAANAAGAEPEGDER